MPYFATIYHYIEDSVEARDAVRPAHRDYLAELTARGDLLLSGPYVGGAAAALLVFDAAGEAETRALTDQDPFVLEGLVAEVSVREWQPVSGRLAPQT
ncbi:hypothetical protein C6I20_15835 [Aeromicrobium sp. A1-2]|uniref:YciI family protein n=1 Tax=Aeromicrobium sp. A1-2 TaxID=2107713 RepID=UPI000E509554|nr:YciI family protein [Aeromicrobium sp. A1-2]AXT86498.1 hypothetical protein C6I20_15835 [Aeromicrobium sp. A1-2]